MTASERAIGAWRSIEQGLVDMGLVAVGLNLAFTLAILVVAMLAVHLVRRAALVAARRIPGTSTAERTVRTARIARFAALLAMLAAGVVAAMGVAAVWGVDLFAFSAAFMANPVLAVLLRLALLALGAAVACEVIGYVIGRGLGRLAAREGERRRQAQLRTLAPILKGVVQAVVIVIVSIMALGEIGVKIGPLLAGAGVVGIAFGLGAQTLVKDFIIGIFLVVEDIVSIGDIVRIGDSGGQVEGMTLRTIRLRDFDGTLHVFPNSEAQVLHNLTKTFSYYVFDLQVSYSSDIDKALRLMRSVGDEMQAEPAFADKILEPIEVVGVDTLADSGVMLKARIKTQPIEQWTVGREYNRRIKQAFDRGGIEIPFPHMQVVLPGEQLSELASH